MSPILVKRVYDIVDVTDGKRILVDRLWPRGLTKKQAAVDVWLKEIAPSHELRKWFHQQPEQFDEFKHAYLKELQQDVNKVNALNQIKDWAETETVTLVYAAKDEHRNQSIILREFIENM